MAGKVSHSSNTYIFAVKNCLVMEQYQKPEAVQAEEAYKPGEKPCPKDVCEGCLEQEECKSFLLEAILESGE